MLTTQGPDKDTTVRWLITWPWRVATRRRLAARLAD